MSDSGKIDVLVVDDSAFMRKLITEAIATDPDINVVGVARNGEQALENIEHLRPDVVTLDIEMPVLDGLGVINRLFPRPENAPPLAVIALSSLTRDGDAEATLKCLELGCVDFIAKPAGMRPEGMAAIREELIQKIKIAAQSLGKPGSARLNRLRLVAKSNVLSDIVEKPERTERKDRSLAIQRPVPTETTDLPRTRTNYSRNGGVMIIGSSTGGPRALQSVVPDLNPAVINMPVVIIQHMPPKFTESLATRLQASSLHGLRVKEAQEGDSLEIGTALLAPGGRHLTFDNKGMAHLNDGPTINGVRPSIDVTVNSLVETYGSGCIMAVLTGMGKDGAAGMKRIFDAGGKTLAEDESTCVIYGMPRACIEIGAAQEVVTLDCVASVLTKMAAVRSRIS